jgi:hypothetical protein
VAEFHCCGLARGRDGQPEPCDLFVFGIYFHNDYLRGECRASDVVTLLYPPTCFHPNVRYPYVCLGHMPAVGIADILFQLYEIVSWQRVTMNERDALNWDACVWSRQHLKELPLDARPLKRRKLKFNVNVSVKEPAHAQQPAAG